MAGEIYLGNPNLKKANTPIEFGQEEIAEFIKCKKDPVYFAKNYVKVINLDKGLVPFDLYPYQEKLYSNRFSRRRSCTIQDVQVPRETCKELS